MHDSFKTLVLGIGNPLRGDDGVGGAIVERLAELNRPDITTKSLHQLLPEFADEIQGYARVVFVDACLDLPPGQWELTTCVDQSTLSPPRGEGREELAGEGPFPSAGMSHHLDPASLLAFAEELFGFAPPAWCLRVGAKRFDFEQQLTPEVAAVVAGCVQCLVALVDAREVQHA